MAKNKILSMSDIIKEYLKLHAVGGKIMVTGKTLEEIRDYAIIHHNKHQLCVTVDRRYRDLVRCGELIPVKIDKKDLDSSGKKVTVWHYDFRKVA